MANSAYKTYLDSVVDSYIERLIRNITHIEESSENFPIATKFAKSNLLYHRFLDVNKNDIQRNLQGIIEKLTIHSQGEKADRLAFLIQRFSTKPLKQDVPDVHYAVLSMLIHLSTNPLESVYYETKFKQRTDEVEQLDEELKQELEEQNQKIMEEWGFSDEASVDDEDEEDEEEEEQQIVENRTKPPTHGLRENNRIEIENENPSLTSQKKQQQQQQQQQPLSMMDKSLLFGTLPMQPFESSFSGIGAFRLPLGEMQPSNTSIQTTSQLNASTTIFPKKNIQSPPEKIFNFPELDHKSEERRSAKKRNHSQLVEHDVEEKTGQVESSKLREKFEQDKHFIEQSFLQKHIWKNPNSLNDILQDFYLKPEVTNSKGNALGVNHWLFTVKTERALIQDLLLMINGVESDSFKLNDQKQFEKREPIQLKHVSPETLTSSIEMFLALANNRLEIDTNLTILKESFNTTVIEGFTECVKEFILKYRDYVEDIQCIFLKQASQVKLKNLGTRHPDLQQYLENKTITMIELIKMLDPFMKNFQMVRDILKNLIQTFNDAAKELEQVVKGELSPAKVQELKPFISMTTLGYLYRLLTDTILCTNENSTNILLIELFFKSWEPYLGILDKWLKHGILMDKYSEFFIKYSMDLNMITNFYSRLNWNKDYVYQTYTVKWKSQNEEKTFICVPSFLSKYTESISTIGKTIKVLGYLIHQENLYLYLSKLDFKEEFFLNLLQRMKGDQEEEEVDPFEENEIEVDLKNKLSLDSGEKIEIKDYTFGAKLRKQTALKDKAPKQTTQTNILYKTIPNKFDTYQSSPDLTRFAINAFSISKPVIKENNNNNKKGNSHGPADSNRMLIEETPLPVHEGKKTTAIKKFYNKVVSKSGQESLNNLKVYLDDEVESLLKNMESHYSTQLTDLLFNHFHLLEYLRILRNVFFMENEPIYENFVHEVLLKVRSSLYENGVLQLNQFFTEALKKVNSKTVKNIPLMFSFDLENKDELMFNFSVINNYSVTFKPTYPLDIIFDQDILKLYNRIFKFLLQIKRAKLALTINSIPMKTEVKEEDIRVKKLEESRDFYGDEMEEEEPYSYGGRTPGERSRVIREANLLKRKFALSQKELLHFVSTLETFVVVSVISENTRKYHKIIQDSSNIMEIYRNLKQYLENIAEVCQLHNKKNDMLFELLKSTLNLCWDFYNLYNRLEECLTFMGGNESSLQSIWNELEMLMKSFQENNKMILQVLNQYHQKGHKLQIKSLFSNLNFNYFYLSEAGDYIRE